MAGRRIKRRQGRAHITDELIIQILSFLPTKSLCRFRCVSKNWISMISQRRTFLPMCGLHINYWKNYYCSRPNRIYASIGGKHVQVWSQFESILSKLLPSPIPFLADACNGLFLYVRAISEGTFKYFVCNPATMECVTLPEADRHGNPFLRSFLAYQPRESPHYKVLCFTEENHYCINLATYSSITGEWVEHLPLVVSSSKWMPRSVYRNGVIYMLDQAGPYLVRFDVERGSSMAIMLPKKPLPRKVCPISDDRTSCIGISRGNIYYTAIDNFRHTIKIWRLEKKGNVPKWSLKHRMGSQTFTRLLLTHATSEYDVEEKVRPLAFHPDSEVVYLCIINKVFSYHPDTEMLEDVCRIPHYESRTSLSWLGTFTVTPSLESINPPGSTVFRW